MNSRYTLLGLLLLLVACGNHSTEGLQIFRYNESAGITSTDPAFAKDQAHIWVCRQLYNGLVQLDTALRVQPCIAHSWDISDDGKQYTFHLRQDVWFHKNELFLNADSTRPVVASDFVYSFNRILDPSVTSPGSWIFSNIAPNGFRAENDSTFVITLKEPFPPFLGQWGMVYCSVVPREVVDHYGTDYRSHPCGTGPFKYQLWKEGVKLVLRRNENYFETDETGFRLPYLDAVAITFIIDRQTVFLEFVKGNLDFMNSIDAAYKDELLTHDGLLREKYSDRIDLTTIPYLNTEYLGFLMDDTITPLQSRLLRRAINYGFDRKKMMKYLRNGIGRPGENGFVPSGLPGFDSCNYGYSYNPTKAMQLLKEAGFENGKGLPSITLQTTANYLDLCKYIQQQLGLLNIHVKIDVNPPASLREQMAQGKSTWFRGSWVADYPDAENYLSLFYSVNRSPKGPNYTHYSNKVFDRLFENARKETDPAIRAQMYHSMDSLVMQDAPVVVLYYDQILHFTHKNISGLRTDAMNTLDLRRVRKQ